VLSSSSVAFESIVALSAAGLLAGMLLASETGRRIGVARFKRVLRGAGREQVLIDLRESMQ
jgi:adenine/guanine phosphoribosyltransferase-like PRPP-binding protein